MAVSGQLHAPADLPLAEKPPLSIGNEAPELKQKK
jgi:hypothetical protein